MQLLLATLCDSAADYQGKLCVLGAFDTLCAQEFPVEHPQCSLAVRLMFYPDDVGRHNLSIQLEDEVGQAVMPPFSATMDVVLPPNSVPFVTRNLVLNLQRLRFEEPGVYRFEIKRNGKPMISLPLRVARMEEMRPTMGPAG
ncbi:hypothetical protein DES53_10128 [Roseimicrobium gellanilyticum]|uniref:Uncharacterized protein n=1 Tax=Roseimicrobium gellanilyticum TaxID=748857 RepID=A0A366HSH3_9BACT|nr:hypothetical protein [Roseimicrobium gellanilyticum]RBP47231.1 hypothetical protein DES53_10128 [Roseimicrobium gellanilyticum]